MDGFVFVLEEFRLNSLFCDAKIISADSEHNAHRVILAAASDFFRTMFQSNFKESESGIIKLEDISGDLMEDILSFIYVGVIDLDELRAFDFYCISDRLRVQVLKDKCSNFLIKNMNLSNCLMIARLGESYSDSETEKAAITYLTQSFCSFISHEDFLDLTKNELVRVIERDDLNVEKEEDVFKAVMLWADKDPELRNISLPHLLTNVRFPIMSLEFLQTNVFDNDRIKGIEWCLDFEKIRKLCVYRYEPHLQNALPDNNSADLPCYSLKLRAPSQIICICGGWSKGRNVTTAECYNPKTDKWIRLRKLQDPAGVRCYYGSAHIGKIAYFAGGYDGTSYLNTVRCYDPITKLWSDIGQMTTKRCFNSLINYKDHLFAIAGFDGVRRLHTVEKYCSSTNQWIRIASLSAARSDSVAVCCGRYIYVIGGYSGNSLRSVEYYDGIIWRYASPLISRRSGAGAVILPDGRIFVMGGYDGTARLMTTEFYDVKTDAWTHGPSMHAARSNFATCVVHGYVYVIGGYTGQSTLDEVERYEISTNLWTKVAKLNFARSAMRASVFTCLPNVEEYVVSEERDSLLDEFKEALERNTMNIQRLFDEPDSDSD